MAEEFVIRIDTGRGRGSGRGTGTGRGVGSPALAGAAAIFPGKQDIQKFEYDERITRDLIKELPELRDAYRGSKIMNLGRSRKMGWEDGTSTYQQTLFGRGVQKAGLDPAFDKLAQNKTALKAGAAGLATKAFQSTMQHRAYTSGDQYQNQVDSNNMRLAGYGAMVAMLGPKAGAVIVINEGINAFNDARQYNFDRAMDTLQINNTQAVAGDISYGRRNGVR